MTESEFSMSFLHTNMNGLAQLAMGWPYCTISLAFLLDVPTLPHTYLVGSPE